MNRRIEKAAETAIEYDSLLAIKSEARRCEHKIYGWSLGHFYEVYPRGRAIEYTDLQRIDE